MTKRKRCVRPHGTGKLLVSRDAERDNSEMGRSEEGYEVRPTMSIIMEVDQLIVPLCDDPQRILEKRHHNQEPSNGR